MALTKKQIEQIKERRAEQGRKKVRRKKPERWLFPNPAARDYTKALQKQTEELQDLIQSQISPKLPSLLKDAEAARVDGLREDDWQDEVNALVNKVKISLGKRIKKPEVIADKVATDVNLFNDAQFHKVIKSVLAVDVLTSEPWLAAKMKSFVKENTKRIKDLPDETIVQVQAVLQNGIKQGHHPARLQRDIMERTAIASRRAELIARDQVGSFNGELTKLRQKEIGIDKYEWITAGDERVRSSHAELAGKIFSWDNPPAIGHPGSPVRCRCIASPVMDDLIKQITE